MTVCAACVALLYRPALTVQMLRSRAEWRRWEESDKRSWDQAKRQRWAEQLWQAQHRRRRESVRLRQRLQQQQARQEMEDEREQRRQQRWGRSSYQSFFRSAGVIDELGEVRRAA